jgi:hypothetical protein
MQEHTPPLLLPKHNVGRVLVCRSFLSTPAQVQALRHCSHVLLPSFPHQTNTVECIRLPFFPTLQAKLLPHLTPHQLYLDALTSPCGRGRYQAVAMSIEPVRRPSVFFASDRRIDSVGGSAAINETAGMGRVASGTSERAVIGLNRLAGRHFRRSEKLNLDWTSMKGSKPLKEPVAGASSDERVRHVAEKNRRSGDVLNGTLPLAFHMRIG